LYDKLEKYIENQKQLEQSSSNREIDIETNIKT
jgi:hypothetical protein